MKFLEKDLEEILWEQMQTVDGLEKLSERGLNLKGVSSKYRQLKIGNYGIADIVTLHKPDFVHDDNVEWSYHDGNILINIIELKKDKISVSAFLQALGYLKGVKNFLRSIDKKFYRYSYKITLIGSTLDAESSVCYLPDFINTSFLNVEFYTYNIDIDGLKFKQEYGYELTNEGF
jgi:hypothetical protein